MPACGLEGRPVLWLPGGFCALLQLGAFGRARGIVLGALPARPALLSQPRGQSGVPAARALGSEGIGQ